MTEGPFVCCFECFQDIVKENPAASKIWLDLCSLVEDPGDLIVFKSLDFDELQYLEKCGFIITTETDKELIIKVLGVEEDEEGEQYCCIKRGDHVSG